MLFSLRRHAKIARYQLRHSPCLIFALVVTVSELIYYLASPRKPLVMLAAEIIQVRPPRHAGSDSARVSLRQEGKKVGTGR